MSEQRMSGETAKTGNVGQPLGAVFHCASCGHEMGLPEALLGRQAKCPKCNATGVVERPRQEMREPDENDVRLDDLVADAPEASSPRPEQPLRNTVPAEASSLVLETRPPAQSLGGHIRLFFAGSLPLNVFSGIVAGGYLALGCLALALLFNLLPLAKAAFPHALLALGIPAVLGSLLFAVHGRLSVALGTPDPATCVAVLFLVAALGSDMQGHAPDLTIRSTLIASVVIASLVTGLLGFFSARMCVGERVRFLPPEAMGGMLAGFGLLLIKFWAELVAVGDPALVAILGNPLGADWLAGLSSSVWTWAPPLGFGLLCFVIQLSTRSLVWPLLAAACALGAWHAALQHMVPLNAAFTTHVAAFPVVNLPLRLSKLVGSVDVGMLEHVNWMAMAVRLEYFFAIALLALVPSMVRTSILEVRLGRDVNPETQLRVLGLANIFSGLLGGAPSSLSLSASLGMRSLGAAGPVAGFVAALVCLGAVVSGPCLLPFVPLFIPLGLLLSTALVMPVSWLLRDARNPLSSDADTHLAWVTCLGTVVLGPVLGVFGCIGLGLANSLWRAVSDGGVRFLQKGDVFHSNVDRSPAERRVLREQGASILVLRLRGYLFLGTLYGLTRIIRQNTGLRYVLLDFGAVTGLGASAVPGFQRLTHLARELGLVLFFTNLPLELEGHMESLGYSMDETGDCRIAVNLDYALEWCEDSILRDAGVLEERNDSLEEMLAATFPEPRLIPVLMKCLERVEVPKKKPVVSQGEASDAMYFLQSGKVHVELALPGGKLLRLKKMGPGTVFGEMGLYTSAPRSATVLATEKCVVYKLSVERFRIIQTKAPQLAAAVNRYIVTLLAERVAEENAKTRASQL